MGSCCLICNRMLARDGSISSVTVQQVLFDTSLFNTANLYVAATQEQMDEFLVLSGWSVTETLRYRIGRWLFGSIPFMNPGIRIVCPECLAKGFK